MNKSFQVFYPASKFDHENLKHGIEIALNKLNYTETPSTIPEDHHFYTGSTEARAKSFLDALNNSVDLIWASRGGYGTIEWLDQIESHLDDYKNKLMIGFSDLTALHSLLSNRGLISIHGPMLASQNFLNANSSELKSLLLCVENQPQHLEIKQGVELKGRLVGGNLSVLSHLMGTPWQLKLNAGDLLFLEDINEAPYALARSLKQLSYSPNFKECHILWGQLTQCSKQPEEELLQTLMEPYSNSWSFGLECGHDLPNYSLRLGQEATLTKHTLIQ